MSSIEDVVSQALVVFRTHVEDINRSWSLNGIQDALPHDLWPYGSDDPMRGWGMTLVSKLSTLAALSRGRHAEVLRAFAERVAERLSTTPMDYEAWVTEQDIDHLVATTFAIGPPVPPMVVFRGNVLGAQVPAAETPAPNSPEASPFVVNPPLDNPFVVNPATINTPAARAPASSAIAPHRRSARIAKKLLDVPLDAAESDDDIESPIVSSRSRKRQRQDEEHDPVENGQNNTRKKRARGRTSQRKSPARQAPIEADSDEEVLGDEATPDPVDQQLSVFDDVSDSMEIMTFEQEFPIPEGATRNNRIRLLKLMKKRNQNLRTLNGPVDAELEYRIHREEILEAQENAQLAMQGDNDGAAEEEVGE